MRTAVAQTSLRAYREIEAEGKLGAQERRILTALHGAWSPGRDWSLQEIVRLTHIPINAVSGRVNGLKNTAPRYLVETEKRRCSVTGRTVMPVTLRQPESQGDLFGAQHV